MRNASIAAASAGAAAATGTALFSAVTAAASPLAAKSISAGEVPGAAGADIFAHVADASTGRITVFHGTEAFSLVDPALARALAQAAQ